MAIKNFLIAIRLCRACKSVDILFRQIVEMFGFEIKCF